MVTEEKGLMYDVLESVSGIGDFDKNRAKCKKVADARRKSDERKEKVIKWGTFSMNPL